MIPLNATKLTQSFSTINKNTKKIILIISILLLSFPLFIFCLRLLLPINGVFFNQTFPTPFSRPLTNTIFVNQSPGFKDKDYPDHIFLLKNSIYGLKQSSRQWLSTFTSYLLQLSFHHSLADTHYKTKGQHKDLENKLQSFSKE